MLNLSNQKSFSQVYRIVEDLYEKTCTNVPLTVNEKQFQDTYLATIEEAIQTLRLKRSEPLQAWASFKLVISIFSSFFASEFIETYVKIDDSQNP